MDIPHPRLVGLDLFSGIGGLTVALAPWVRTVAYCDNNRYAQAVLLAKMASCEIPIGPIWDDVTTLVADQLPQPIEIIFGGFPCQDISMAGRGAGIKGERSGLFFEIARLAGELRPKYIFLENVSAVTIRGQEQVVGALTELGYDCRWTIVSAADVGANHLRKRWFLLGYSSGSGRERNDWGEPGKVTEERRLDAANDEGTAHGQPAPESVRRQKQQSGDRTESPDVADTQSQRVQGSRAGREQEPHAHDGQGLSLREGGNASDSESQPIGAGLCSSRQRGLRRRRPCDSSWWAVEPNVGRVANGVPLRVERLTALGNAVVPLQAREAFRRLITLNFNEE